MDVFLLWHIYELKDDFGTQDEEKLIGVFSSELKAREAIERLRGREGFRAGGARRTAWPGGGFCTC